LPISGQASAQKILYSALKYMTLIRLLFVTGSRRRRRRFLEGW
jgi:hypothetical protein